MGAKMSIWPILDIVTSCPQPSIEANELAFENCEAQAIDVICEFDATVLNPEKFAADVDTNAAPPIPESKPKFKPRDLFVPKMEW